MSTFIAPGEVASSQSDSKAYPSWDLLPAQACDLELILTGGFSPLTGFMTRAEAAEVREHKTWRGQFFPVPVQLQVSRVFSEALRKDGEDAEKVALRDQEGLLVAILQVSEIYSPDQDTVFLAGECQGIAASVHHDFKRLRHSPEVLQSRFNEANSPTNSPEPLVTNSPERPVTNSRNVMGYMTREPLHQKEVHAMIHAARQVDARTLISLATGAVRPEDPAHYARVHAVEWVLGRFPPDTTDLTLLPLAHQADLDGLLLHALTLRNSGCSHYLVDERYPELQAGSLDYPGLQRELSRYDQQLGLTLVHHPRMVYRPARGGYVTQEEATQGALADEVNELSPADFKRKLEQGLAIPDWFSWPEVMQQLRKIIKPRTRQGFTLFFTGLSGSGKSTIANAVLVTLMETGDRPITLLDGDLVRKILSSELGFSKAHRDLNIRRIGYVASEITRHGGIAICAPIAPYATTRDAVRAMIEPAGGFIEVHISTSLEECERRDRKGLYARARAGIIKEFTGISDPYEIPANPELRIDTEGMSPDEAAGQVIGRLQSLGYLGE